MFPRRHAACADHVGDLGIAETLRDGFRAGHAGDELLTGGALELRRRFDDGLPPPRSPP